MWKVGRWDHDGCPQVLLTPERLTLIEVWARWKMFGQPLSGGWSEWPARLVDLLEVLEAEEGALRRMKLDGS